ncbi:MAG: L,D-transpeptidase [Kiritimatiellaeota bacterium]|nr:L,D-transpeptidase [Kiritimatiellota bacterium]
MGDPMPDNTPVDIPDTLTDAQLHALAMQSALDRAGFGVGLIDAAWGPKSQAAFDDFCWRRELDAQEAALVLTNDAPLLLAFNVPDDLSPFVADTPTDWEEAAACEKMLCRSLLDWVADTFHQHPTLTRRLNPHVTDWNAPGSNTVLRVVNIRPASFMPGWCVGSIEINTRQFRLRVFSDRENLLMSFPCSIAREKTRVPAGELVITAHAPNPNYTFDPANYADNPRAQEIGRKLILPPGPRNPVGVYWLSLSKPGYGIHGTPKPETIGNMESLGCFRLCNWDAHTLGNAIKHEGVTVRLVP